MVLGDTRAPFDHHVGVGATFVVDAQRDAPVTLDRAASAEYDASNDAIVGIVAALEQQH